MARAQGSGRGRGGGAPDIGGAAPKISRGRIVSHCFVDPPVFELIKKFGTFGKSLTNGLDSIYGYLEHGVILQPGQGAEIKRRRDAVKGLLMKAVKRVGEDVNIINTGQPLRENRLNIAAGFAVHDSIGYKGLEPGDKLDILNASIKYLLRHMLRSPCLEAGTPVEDFSTDEAAAFFLERITIFDASSVCCKATKSDKSGNKWATAKKQLESLAAKLVPELSEEECKLFFPAVYVLINLGPRVAYMMAETGESTIVLNACTRNMKYIHGGARAHGCGHDLDILTNKYLTLLNIPHPEFTNTWMKSAMYTPEMQQRNAEHLARFLSYLSVGDTGVRLPTVEDCYAYYERRSADGDETAEERAARREAMRRANKKGGTNCYLKGTGCHTPANRAKGGRAAIRNIQERSASAEQFLSAAVDKSDMPVEDIIELLGMTKKGCWDSYAPPIDRFLGHLAVVRECLADSENVHVFEDCLLMVLVPSKREHASTYFYVLELATELSNEATGEQRARDWRVKALLREGIDLGRYEEGVDCILARRKKEERKRKRAKLEQYCAAKGEEDAAEEGGGPAPDTGKGPAPDDMETHEEYVLDLFADLN